jgi:exopolysaccharide biosynthesis polyprenyl glycosylphosphotransferase
MSAVEHDGGPVSVAVPVPLLRPGAGVVGELGADELRASQTWRGRRDYVFRRVLAVSDMFAIASAALVAFVVSPVGGADQFLWLLPILPAWVAVFGAYGLYQRDSKRISSAGLDDLPAIFHGLVVGTLVMWLYYRLVPAHELVFIEALAFGVLGLAVITAVRFVARRAMTSVLGPERVLFLGESRSLPALVRKIRDHPEYGLEPVGLVARSREPQTDAPIPIVGRIEDASLGDLVERHDIERVIVSRSGATDEAMLELFQECRDLGVKVSLLPAQVDVIGPSVQVDDIEGITVLGLKALTLSRSSRFLKRGMDILGAGVGLLLLSPVLAMVAVAIKLDSKGSVLFRQRRVGRRGRSFHVIKFRTMVSGAEDQADELFAESEDPGWLKLEHDPRITRVGRFLRLTSLDELPQLWNVLRGDMSLVGPRPLIETEHAAVTGWARTRTDLAPGVTGLWQALGRTNIPFEEMVKLDYLYVTNWSLWLDVKLLLQTFPVVVRRRGAN